MHRLYVRVVTTAVLCIVLGLLGVVSAQASEGSNCDSTLSVTGTDSGLTESINTPQVMTQADRLKNEGADVRIRVIDSFPGTAEAYIGSLLATCQSWQSADHQEKLRENMVVFAVVLALNGDHGTKNVGVRGGSDWDSIDNATATSIAHDNMAPYVHNYAYNVPATYFTVGAGIAAGEQRAADIIHEQKHSETFMFWFLVIILGIVVSFVLYALFVVISEGGGGRGGSGWVVGGGGFSDGGGGGGGDGGAGSASC